MTITEFHDKAREIAGDDVAVTITMWSGRETPKYTVYVANEDTHPAFDVSSASTALDQLRAWVESRKPEELPVHVDEIGD